MVKKIWGIAFLLSSCASIAPTTGQNHIGSTGEYYKKDLGFTVNGETHKGVAVLEAFNTYSFSITPDKPFDLFTAQTCHREIHADQVTFTRKSRWFSASDKTSIRFSYTPRSLVETDSFCPIEIGIYDKDNGQEYWAFIDFVKDLRSGLGATLYCNGDILTPSNSAICQARRGLRQRIKFKSPVTFLSECLDVETEDSMTFTWYQPYQSCVSLFANSEGEKFRLVTFGYNRIKIKDYNND